MSNLESTSPAPARRRTALARPLALFAIATSLLLLVVLAGAAYAGYQAGLNQRASQFSAARTVELQVQYRLGVDDIAAGRYEVAVARFEYILQLDPNYPNAAQKLTSARLAMAATATQPVAPTATLAPPTPTLSHEASEIYAQAVALYQAQDWNGTLDALAHLHAVDPEYQAVKVDGMIYVCLRNRGVERIKGDNLESGIYDLEQAEAFGPLDSEANNYRAWARLYMAAQSFWGVNWMQSMLILQQLYIIAPNFHDTTNRLFVSTVRYADQLVAAGDYCVAAENYAAALAVTPDAAVSEKQAQAMEDCQLTPTPGAEGSAGGTPIPTPTS